MVFKLFYRCSILINFNHFYRGVRQGQKGHHENKTTYYQSQYRDSTAENHIYDEPRQPRGQTPVEDRQELTVSLLGISIVKPKTNYNVCPLLANKDNQH